MRWYPRSWSNARDGPKLDGAGGRGKGRLGWGLSRKGRETGEGFGGSNQ